MALTIESNKYCTCHSFATELPRYPDNIYIYVSILIFICRFNKLSSLFYTSIEENQANNDNNNGY